MCISSNADNEKPPMNTKFGRALPLNFPVSPGLMVCRNPAFKRLVDEHIRQPI